MGADSIMLNVCFSESAKGLLKFTQGLNSNVVCIQDDLSVGNIKSMQNQIRSIYECFKSLENYDYDDIFLKEQYIVFLEEIYKHSDINIWYSNSPYEFCGMLYTLWVLGDHSPTVNVINCSQKLQQINNNFIYKSVSEIAPEDIDSFLSFKKELSIIERNTYVMLWKRLMDENGQLRVFEKGTIITTEISYYDELILNEIPNKPERIGDILAKILIKLAEEKNIRLADNFIAFRIKELIKKKVLLEIDGNQKFYENKVMKSLL